ncbi:MAG: hypothetical protein OCC45_00655 [Desulfotalea sp.]
MTTLLKNITLVITILLCNIACTPSLEQTAATYIAQNYTMQESENKITVDIEKIQSNGNYAVIDSPALFYDGSETLNFIEDLVFVLCVEKKSKWSVIYDLSRSDVPSKEELKSIRANFPEEFPMEILPRYWQELLKAKSK